MSLGSFASLTLSLRTLSNHYFVILAPAHLHNIIILNHTTMLSGESCAVNELCLALEFLAPYCILMGEPK